ncbi:MAG TPA: GNAT family N-acetyltransferase [Anaerolineales bacterium]|nr:GNAT family N-acetyltransferase [Anaerolineales bacterium]
MLNLQIVRTRHPPEPYFAQIAALQTEAGYPSMPEDIRRRLEVLPREDRLLLAMSGETVLGYAHLRVAHDLLNEETAEVVVLLVGKAHRRRGVGRRLIAAAETWALESGRARLLLRTDVVRTDAHAFYIALGYEEASTSLEFVRDLEKVRRADRPTRPTT